MRNRIAVVLPALAVLVSAGAQLGSTVTARAATSCGVERWAVKTGTDSDAARVNLGSATATTVAYLGSQPRPASLPSDSRVAPVETTQWVLDATLVEDKLETDSDYHLVLHDAAGRSMIAEIPSPDCVAASSPFLAAIQRARAQFDTSYAARDTFSTLDVPVRVTGVGFFDFQHGQTGVAPNAVELHPVTNITFNPSGPLTSSGSGPAPAATTPQPPSAAPTLSPGASAAAPGTASPSASAGAPGHAAGPPAGAATSGQSSASALGLLLFLGGLFFLLVAAWGLVRGRVNWLRLRSRKAAAAVAGLAFLGLCVGAVMSSPTSSSPAAGSSAGSTQPARQPSPSPSAAPVAPSPTPAPTPTPSVAPVAVAPVAAPKPAPSHPAAAPTHQAAAPSCSASMSDPTPVRGASETVRVASNQPSASVTVAVHYKTTTSTYGGATDGTGAASVTFRTGSPTPGYTVVVDVTAGAAHCQTSFTPHA